MSRKSGFDGTVWEKRVAFAFSVWSPKNCTRVLKNPLIFADAARSILPMYTPAGPGGSSLSPSRPQGWTTNRGGRHSISPWASLARAGVTRLRGSLELTPLSELRFPDSRTRGGEEPHSRTTRMCIILKT